jgi:hypothetical protein
VITFKDFDLSLTYSPYYFTVVSNNNEKICESASQEGAYKCLVNYLVIYYYQKISSTSGNRTQASVYIDTYGVKYLVYESGKVTLVDGSSIATTGGFTALIDYLWSKYGGKISSVSLNITSTRTEEKTQTVTIYTDSANVEYMYFNNGTLVLVSTGAHVANASYILTTLNQTRMETYTTAYTIKTVKLLGTT